MSMFTNYENNNTYTAYNLTPKIISPIIQKYTSSPIIIYDKYNNIKSFIWDPKDSFNLKIALGSKIKVFEDSLIYNNENEYPGESTSGNKGQKAYNTVRGISWTCKGTLQAVLDEGNWIPLEADVPTADLPDWVPMALMQVRENTEQDNTDILNRYVWVQDKLLSFPANGTKEITIVPNMENKELYITIMNFRHEVIYEYSFKNIALGNIAINSTDTPMLVEGQFFLNIYVVDKSVVQEQTQIAITIIENPNKYILSKDNIIYIDNKTIQQENNYYTWQSLNVLEDYIWIPLGE